MKRKLTPVVMLAALTASLTLSLTPVSAEAGRGGSREERQAAQERDNRPRNEDRRQPERPRDDGNIDRAVSAGSSRGRVLDTRPAGSNYVVRVQTPEGRRVDLTVDGRTGRVLNEK